MEDLYREALEKEIGSSLSSLNPIRTSIYEGEQAFLLQTHCVSTDTPPTYINDKYVPHYKIELKSLDHDMCMYILTNLKDAFPPTDNNITIKPSRISKELSTIGLGYMSRWVVCCRDGTYNIIIRHLRYKECSTICRILFTW